MGALGESNAGERLTPFESQWVAAVAADLQLAENRGASIIVVGDSQPAVVHALAHAMNQRLGNVQARRDGAGTVAYVASVQPAAIDQMQSLRELTADIQQDRVELLVILGGNPVYNTPADLGFEELLLAKKDMVSVHLSEYLDETSWVCHWHIPAANYLESWSDARAYDGTATILQPLIAPLYDGRTAHEVVAALAGQADRSSYDLVRAHWERERGAEGFAEFWQRTLYYGFAADSQAELVAPELAASSSFAGAASPASAKGLELIFRPDPHVWDGRFANNGWLQELPRPLTKLTWDNVAFVSPATAEERKLKDGDVVKLQYREGEVRMPVWVLPWQANNSVSVALGFGRTRGVQVGRDVGANAYALRTSDAPWFGQGLEMVAINERYALSTTQSHHSMEGRDPVRFGELADYEHNPGFLHHHHDAHRVPGAPDDQPETPGSLYREHPYEGYRWGMTIDLNSCMGCNACVVACQAENNIPVVGKVEVARGREMHWLRIDRYYYGAGNELADDQSYALDRPETLWQPMLCQHCENAPCEVVCPVAATVHSSEGLNEMVYNRCVGTRYCSNNCPYKVRRFNFFQYSDLKTPSLELMRNPDVTVRNRGVMEKCTFCVQRINLARIDAKKRDTRVQDGDVVTACQAACPSQAIVFGDINDPKSKVHHLKHEPLNYGVLADLNTQPRTSYLGRVMNPNPALLDLERKTYGRQLPHG
ncbi:MAG TPA: 4Fe-4S dicluster domain-containing protein [Polyangiaceae bacterium]|nr:4Fe-4S dicluster domain-containing protein [Polyangiaceae bacterium]